MEYTAKQQEMPVLPVADSVLLPGIEAVMPLTELTEGLERLLSSQKPGCWPFL